MSFNDLLILFPEIIVIITGLSILIIDLFVPNKRILPIVTVFGLFTALVFLIYHLSSDLVINESSLLNSAIVFDQFGILYKFIIIFCSISIIIGSTDFAKSFNKFSSEFYALMLFSTSGMMLLSSASELIFLYLSIELTTLPLIALSALHKTSKSTESSLKFLILAAISSAILLYGIVLLYGLTGTTDIQLITTTLTELFKNGETKYRGLYWKIVKKMD